jgi:hypothetical protein
MADATQPLVLGEHGRYVDLIARPRQADLVLQFIPTLVSLLGGGEEIAGRPLTRDEVLRIRDQALVVVTYEDVAEAVAADRGYADLDPNDPWSGWIQLRNGKER